MVGCASLEPAPPSTAVMAGPPAAAPQPGCNNPAFQQALLQELNAARTRPQMCSAAALPAARPVRWNPALAAAATSHSADMARRDLFGHRGSDGSTVEQRVRRQGYTPLAAGESIAGGDYNADSLVNTWLGNERHCRTLMDPAFTEVGASCASHKGSDWGTYWTMVMGNRSEPVRRVAPAPSPRAKAPVATPKAGKPRVQARSKAVPSARGARAPVR